MSSAPSRSSDTPDLTRIAEAVAAAVEMSGESVPLVVIDGRSGAGKSTLAGMLRDLLPGQVDVLALDCFYPGWDGLAAAAVMLADDVLAPWAAGAPGRWRRWDWEAGVAAEEHLVSPGRTLVVEGVGALTPPTAALATVSVWLDAPPEWRFERAIARDGDAYAPHWQRWAEQEERHIAANDPAGLADLVYDDSPSAARTSASSR